VVKFGAILVAGLLLAGTGVLLLERKLIDFTLPSSKTVLVVGDSHIECAVNDEILTNAFNFAQAGASHFYSYLKVKAILDNNPQIDTVVLCHSFDDLDESRDEWFSGAQHIRKMMPLYLFLFDSSDFRTLLASNPYDVCLNVHQTPLVGVKKMIQHRSSNGSLDRWGTYVRLKRDKLREAKQLFAAAPKNDDVTYSRYQQEYLLKIYHLVRARNIKLILLNTPIHPMLEEEQARYQDSYYAFVRRELPEAVIVNHANLAFPEECFADLEHLNYQGSERYSKYLQEHGFSPLPPTESLLDGAE
jgi:hypothetical protein